LLLVAATGGFAAAVGFALDGTSQSEVARCALAAALLALVGVVLARFEIPEPVSLANSIVRPFFSGLREVARRRLTWGALIGSCVWFFVTLTVGVALVRLAPAVVAEGTRDLTLRFVIGLGIGILVSALNRNTYRHGGVSVFAAVAAVVFAFWLRASESWGTPLLGLGISLGAAISPLVQLALTWMDAKARGVAASLVVAGACVAALVLAGVLTNVGDDATEARSTILTILVVVTCLGLLGSLLAFFRPALEVAAEVIIAPLYRVEGTGPGLDQVPFQGPCLVIANHAAWFDPLFLAKVLPRPITPMMTSRFYDLPVLSWIMRNIIGTIRVPEKSLRHEAPELKEAVAALDRGACIILFPEGYLRRKEEQPIRRFGRGVWQILRDRPDTPVFAGWIDGNWGSYFSYKGGPPTKNKRFDFWRRIRIAVTGPLTVDPAILKDHMATRMFLMERVSAARAPLGLEPLAIERVPDEEKE
jgi:1-acyl-sn-glycerol-3-phosphate acyltransferase